jgi:hypothetical protein
LGRNSKGKSKTELVDFNGMIKKIKKIKQRKNGMYKKKKRR